MLVKVSEGKGWVKRWLCRMLSGRRRRNGTVVLRRFVKSRKYRGSDSTS